MVSLNHVLHADARTSSIFSTPLIEQPKMPPYCIKVIVEAEFRPARSLLYYDTGSTCRGSLSQWA